MKSDRPLKIETSVALREEPAPDVWWGEDGIDALIWADAEPYTYRPAEYTAPCDLAGGLV